MQCEGLLQLHDALVGFITCKCQVVRYERGQRFDLHEDAFAWEQVKQDNYQRHATLLVYLNDVEHGGVTRFPDLDLEIKPRCGQGLVGPSVLDGWEPEVPPASILGAIHNRFPAGRVLIC
ncbi:unnamed protein product [Cladocopium goreaui]|uniref:Probable prolyl 4-hydroxylase 9 (AtP4H9) n=1 Tax=Cladocopium goreaui TaxID=2562237 RepID=A0A9P1CIX1_9DINO|nr:unnamed protein product [Cladocopium goreaui]